MSVQFGAAPAAPIVPYRATYVTFGEHLPTVVQPLSVKQWSDKDLALSASAVPTDVVHMPEIGWRVKPYLFPDELTELTAAQSCALSASQWTLGSSLQESNFFAQLGLPGVTYSGDVTSVGYPHIQKLVGSGSSFSVDLAADSTAYPGPNTSEDTCRLDRWMVWSHTHEPSDSVSFNFYVPGTSGFTSGPIMVVYFCGPAGSDSLGAGIGQYGCKLFGSGVAKLYELTGAGAWLYRHTFTWCESAVFGAYHSLGVVSDAIDSPGDGYPGKKIRFIPWNIDTSHGADALVSAAISAIANKTRLHGILYTVPRKTEAHTTVAPLRIDVRQDIRPAVMVAKAVYRASGTLRCDPFNFDFFPNAANPIHFQVYGDFPAGTSVDVDLYDSDSGSALSGKATVATSTGLVEYTFTPTARQRGYYPVLTLTTDAAHTATPTVKGALAWVDQAYDSPSVTSVEAPQQDAALALPKLVCRDFTITQQREDPAECQASFIVDDPGGLLDAFRLQSGTPVKIETTYDAGGTNRAILFRGYVQTCVQAPRSKNAAGFGGSDKRTMRVTAVGEWVRLQESVVTGYRVWIDPLTAVVSANDLKLYKVTEVITQLALGTVPDTYLSIPDLPTRLVSTDADVWTTWPGTMRGDAMQSYAKEFLGGYPLWDDSIGTKGKLRLIVPKTPTYTYLYAFRTDSSGTGLPHMAGSGGTATKDAQTVDASTVWNFRHYVIRAEANVVYVLGGPANNDSAKAGGQAMGLSQVAVNVNSFDVFGVGAGNPGYPDTTHPDFIGRHVCTFANLPFLTNQAVVDWYCRRIYDYTCHSKLVVEFTGPLVLVTDSTDSEQLRPRPLRHYDVVLFYWQGAWTPFLVDQVVIKYDKDHMQVGEYRLVRPSNLDEVASAHHLTPSGWKLAQEAHNAATGSATRASTLARSNVRDYGAGQIMHLPEPSAPPLQDLDPASAHYGEFYFMDGYDSYGP